MRKIVWRSRGLQAPALAGPRACRPPGLLTPALAGPVLRSDLKRAWMGGSRRGGGGAIATLHSQYYAQQAAGDGGSRGRGSCACDDVIQLDNNNGATRVSEFRIVRDDVIAHWRGVRCIVGRFLSSECCVHRTN